MRSLNIDSTSRGIVTQLVLKMNRHYKSGHRKISKLYWILVRIIFCADISYKAEISSSVHFMHSGLGVVISDGTHIGNNTYIYQNVTTGGNGSAKNNGHPYIGNNVIIYSGAIVLGNITIGDNSIIGANAVVLQNVPENCVAVGVPARIINKATLK